MIRSHALGFGIVLLIGCLTAPILATGGGGFDRAIEAVLPRVVKLYGLGAGAQVGYGSGVIVSADGLVLTVDSLLIDARNIRATDSNGAHYRATVVHRDERMQLALLQLSRAQLLDVEGNPETGNDLPPLRFPHFDLSEGAEPQQGDWVVAAGNAFRIADGAEPVSVAVGVFSGRTRLLAQRRLKDFPYTGDVLVIDSITNNPGMPGGALVNLDGRLLGMIGREVISSRTHTHLNYAVPTDVLEEFIERAANFSSRSDPLARAASDAMDRKRPDLGIRIAPAGYRTVLPFVERVSRGSPAAKAGVRADDLILSVNDRQVSDADAYHRIVATLAYDEPVELVIRRKQEIKSIRIEAPTP